MDQLVIDIVFPVLQAKVPGTKLEKTALNMSAELEKEVKLQSLQNNLAALKNAMFWWIMSSGLAVDYGVVQNVAAETAVAVKEAVCRASTSPLKTTDPALLERLEFAFTKLAYRGDACTSFRAYLNRCWEEYSSRPDAYKAPYLSIVQSSGFGKSRLLQELAQVTSKEKGGTARVLYVCARREPSTGYPQATINLHDWLLADGLTEADMTSRLEVIYYYAQQNWEAVGTNWLALFTTSQADLTVANALKAAELEWRSSNTTQPVANRVVVLVVDEARSLLTERPDRINKFRVLRHALKNATANIRRRHVNVNGGIIAVLADTNSRVADFTPSLANEPSSRMDHNDPPFTLFPPFVLTHTMDVHWQHGAHTNGFSDYKDAVLGSTNTEAWKHLISMGRPLWKSTFDSSMEQSNDEAKATESVLALAARKLLLGGTPLNADNYNESTMFGVASMLCRLGLRPYSRSSLASRAVADFMAILAYVDYENDGHVSSYSSDPVLALGATEVWYANDTALSNHLLPQLNKLLLNEILDVGEVGEVLARILLLLVMDACVVKMEQKTQSHRDCQFSGQLVDVQLFMEALVGSSPVVKMERQKVADQKTQDAFETWRARWDGWQVGFCHFVQLFSEPTEEMLWMLLGRRAAGVFPRNQSGADLVLPILHQGQRKVSLMLIQVKNVAGHDSGFPKTATVKMNPSYVFSPKNTLSKKPPTDVIRVYVSLREAEEQFIRYDLAEVKPKDGDAKQANAPDSRGGSKTATSAARQVTSQKRRSPRIQQKAKADPNNASSSADGDQQIPTAETVDAFTLCIRSMKPWALSRHNLSPIPDAVTIVNTLMQMAAPLWEPIALVRGNLSCRAEMEKNMKDTDRTPRLSKVMPNLDLLQAAQRALLHGTLGGADVEDEEKAAAQIGQSVASAPTDEPPRKRRKTH